LSTTPYYLILIYIAITRISYFIVFYFYSFRSISKYEP